MWPFNFYVHNCTVFMWATCSFSLVEIELKYLHLKYRAESSIYRVVSRLSRALSRVEHSPNTWIKSQEAEYCTELSWAFAKHLIREPRGHLWHWAEYGICRILEWRGKRLNMLPCRVVCLTGFPPWAFLVHLVAWAVWRAPWAWNLVFGKLEAHHQASVSRSLFDLWNLLRGPLSLGSASLCQKGQIDGYFT